MRFVICDSLAGELRGKHIAEQLGVPYGTDYQPSEWVVFVKTFDDIERAKQDGCMVAVDPVDYYCYPMRETKHNASVDLVVIPGRGAMKFYARMFPRADFLIVPHQWDNRIAGECEQDEFRPGYIGKRFNLTETLHVPVVHEESEMLSAMPRFNCHLVDRPTPVSSLLKPGTKVANASAVGAAVITPKDTAAYHLLGDDYPFYSSGTLFDALFRAKRQFGSDVWQQAREMMAQVREKTSLKAVSDIYRVLM